MNENLKEDDGIQLTERIDKLDIQNYPNPFNPTTNFEIKIDEPGFVNLKVYDVLGREIAVLMKEERSTGIYKLSFDGSQFPSGIYFYRLELNNKSITKKMLLVK